MCIVGGGISEENQAYFQDKRVDFTVLSKGGLLTRGAGRVSWDEVRE